MKTNVDGFAEVVGHLHRPGAVLQVEYVFARKCIPSVAIDSFIKIELACSNIRQSHLGGVDLRLPEIWILRTDFPLGSCKAKKRYLEPEFST